MINLGQIIVNAIVGFLDTLKTAKPRLWALAGTFFIIVEQILLSGAIPALNVVPELVVTIIVGVALSFTNMSTTAIVNASKQGVLPGTIGGIVDQFLGLLVDKLKAGNLTVYSWLAILFSGLKFYIVSDPTLGAPELLINALLSLALLFTNPRTKPFLIERGLLTPEEAAARSGAKIRA